MAVVVTPYQAQVPVDVPRNAVQASTPEVPAYGAQALEHVTQALGSYVDARDRQAKQDALLREHADRMQAAAMVANTREQMRSAAEQMSEDIRTGQVDKTQAGETWKKRLDDMSFDAVKQVPSSAQQWAQTALVEASAPMSGAVQKAVRDRDISDNKASLLSFLETQQREAAAGTPGSREAAQQAIESNGPYAGFSPAEQQKLSQNFSEGVAFTRGYTMISQARDSITALNAAEKALGGKEFDVMDPQKKAQLINGIDMRRDILQRQAEAAAQRAAMEEERRMRVAGASVDSLSKLLERGLMPNDQFVATVNASVRGTPYETIVPQLVKQAATVGGFASQTIATMNATLDKMQNDTNARGTDPQRQQEIEQLTKLRDAAVKDYASDPLTAARDRGVIPSVDPINVQGLLTDPNAAQDPAWQKRLRDAGIATQAAGKPASPLTLAEASQLSDQLSVMNPTDRARAASTLAQTVTDGGSLGALARQLGQKDKAIQLAIMYQGVGTTNNRPVGELILRGQQGMKDGTVKVDKNQDTGWRKEAADLIPLNTYVDSRARDDVLDAATLIAAGFKSEGRNPDMRQAVNLATGGLYEQSDGSKVPKPYGWKDDDYEKRLAAFTPKSLAAQVPEGKVYANGVALPVADFVKQLPKATLAAVGAGKYIVRAGPRFVANEKGAPIVLDFNQ